MPPSPIPAPLPPWAKFLLQLAPLIAPYLQELLEHIGTIPDYTQPGSSWRRAVCTYYQTSNPDPADQWVTTLDIANITGGQLDDTWTAQDYTTVDAQVASMANGWANAHSTTMVKLKDIKYYRMAFNPLDYQDPVTLKYPPFAKSGPPEHILPGTGLGIKPAGMPAQVSLTHTELTAYPRHWGRGYWPIPGGDLFDSSALFTPAICDDWCQSVHDWYNALMTAEFYPVVPVTQVNRERVRGLLGVTGVQVDNVPDIQRRRRHKTTTYRKRLPL